MSRSIGLVVDGDNRVRKPIREEYFRFLREKERDMFPENVNNESLYADVFQETRKNSSVVTEAIYSDTIEYIAQAGVYDVFDELIDNGYDVVSGEDIKPLIERLRKAKELTKLENTVYDPEWWEQTYELQYIALPEFALEHDYEISMSL